MEEKKVAFNKLGIRAFIIYYFWLELLKGLISLLIQNLLKSIVMCKLRIILFESISKINHPL